MRWHQQSNPANVVRTLSDEEIEIRVHNIAAVLEGSRDLTRRVNELAEEYMNTRTVCMEIGVHDYNTMKSADVNRVRVYAYAMVMRG